MSAFAERTHPAAQQALLHQKSPLPGVQTHPPICSTRLFKTSQQRRSVLAPARRRCHHPCPLVPWQVPPTHVHRVLLSQQRAFRCSEVLPSPALA